MFNLTIITPVSRPENIPLMEPGIIDLKRQFNVNWLKMEDDLGKDIGGGRKRNAGLDIALKEDCYIWHLDDDTTVHPSFGATLLSIIRNNQDRKAIIFGQQVWPNGQKRANVWKLAQVKFGKIDTQMFVLHSSCCQDDRWQEDEYTSDGLYFPPIIHRLPKNEVIISRVPCIVYNTLRPEEKKATE